MTDEANPRGMERPIIPMKGARPRIKMTHKGYSDEPTPSRNRPMIPVHTKAKGRPTIAVGEGNNPQDMERPKLKLKTQEEIWDDEPDDGLDVPDFVQPKDRPY